MSILSKLRIESAGITAASIFYFVAGIAFIVLLFLSGFPPHFAVMGILSLIATYGLLRKRFWTIGVVAILFLTATTFSLYMLYYVFLDNLIISIGAACYLVLTWMFTVYVLAKRKTLES
ncbi:MAG: hypothetical protein QHH24_01460 [Candidatus Bathyarchaeota archaeon]|nr:hypothetical protein [Candidatus Bathyarchaeota archaeon]